MEHLITLRITNNLVKYIKFNPTTKMRSYDYNNRYNQSETKTKELCGRNRTNLE